MSQAALWTKNFIMVVLANAFMFGGFHILLPTLPLYAAYTGATGSQIGVITGIFGFSAIFIRLFTDWGVKKIGKKWCLYAGLVICFLCTLAYVMFTSVGEMIAIRIFHGIGFGLTTTFSAAIAADIIPVSRRGEGIGYFGLGSTVAMALAPAAGVWLVHDYGYVMMFGAAAAGTFLAILGVRASHAPIVPIKEPDKMSLKDKLFEHGTGIPALLTMLFGLSYGSVNTFVAMLAKEANIADAGYFFVVGTCCVFLSRPIGGRVFDRKGPAWILLPGSVLFLAALLILINTNSLRTLLIASVLYGFGGGFLLPALITWMLNLVKAERRSAASATFYNMLDVGTSAGAILLGAVAEHIGFIKMYLFSAASMVLFIVAFVAYLILRSDSLTTKQEEIA